MLAERVSAANSTNGRLDVVDGSVVVACRPLPTFLFNPQTVSPDLKVGKLGIFFV